MNLAFERATLDLVRSNSNRACCPCNTGRCGKWFKYLANHFSGSVTVSLRGRNNSCEVTLYHLPSEFREYPLSLAKGTWKQKLSILEVCCSDECTGYGEVNNNKCFRPTRREHWNPPHHNTDMLTAACSAPVVEKQHCLQLILPRLPEFLLRPPRGRNGNTQDRQATAINDVKRPSPCCVRALAWKWVRQRTKDTELRGLEEYRGKRAWPSG